MFRKKTRTPLARERQVQALQSLKYEKLPSDKNTVRLVMLEPSIEQGAVIRCTLKSVKLSDNPSYEALSYTWGGSQLLSTILLNECAVNITTNLYDCLRRLRGSEESRVLWIDTLSINQSDDKEKSHQIRLMAHIYSKAVHVVAWLGEAADGSDDVMSFVNNDPQLSDAHNPNTFEHTNNQARFQQLSRLRPKIDDFLDRPYWNRTWIIQELRKAKKQVVVCGSSQVEGDRLHRLLDLHSVIGFYGFASLRHLAGTPGQEQDSQGLIDLIRLSQDTECTDIRDKIYALLGLLRNNDPLKALHADYSISETQLFFRVLQQLPSSKEGDADIGVYTVLQTLKLKPVTVMEKSTTDLGCSMISVVVSKGLNEDPNLLSVEQFSNNSRLKWSKSKSVHTDDFCLAAKNTDTFFFTFRRGPRGAWKHTGHIWQMPWEDVAAANDLDIFNTFFHNYSNTRVTIEKLRTLDDKVIYSIRLSKLLQAVVELYAYLFAQWRIHAERANILKEEGQYDNGASAPGMSAPWTNDMFKLA